MSDYGQNTVDKPDAFVPAALIKDDSAEQIQLMDTLTNLITGLGSATGDKTTNSRFSQSRSLRFDFQQLTALYRENWIAGSIVDAVPDDMTRAWRRLSNNEILPKEIRQWETLEDELNIRYYFNFATKMARLYGGSVIVLDLEGTGDPDTPLNWRLLKKGCLRHMKVVDLTRIMPGPQIITNPLDPNYGSPQIYRFAESGVAIHNSRIIRFDGTKLPFQEFRRNGYWHDTILNRLYDPLANVDTMTQIVLNIIEEYNVDVHKIEGLMDYLMSPEQTKVLIKRMQLTKQLKSTTNLMVVDSKDEVTVQSKQLQGLPSILDRYLVMVTAASDVPAGRILGDSASAFSITHQGMDMKNYYDTIQSKQVIDFNPKLKFIDAIMAIHLGWNDKYELDFEWNSIFQKTPEEEAKAERARGDVYSLYINNGVLSKSQVAKDLQNNPYFENITNEYITQLEQDDKLEHKLKIDNAKLDFETKKFGLESSKQAAEQETQLNVTPQKTPAKAPEKSGMHKGEYDPKKDIKDTKTNDKQKAIKDKAKESKSLGISKDKAKKDKL